MPNIDELRQSRSSTKGSITRIKNLVSTTKLSPTELECRLGIVESYFKQLLAFQTQIESVCPDDAARGELEDLYVTTKAKILSQLGNERRGSTLETTWSMPQVANHLPNLRLPRFSGKYSEYKNFISTFTTLVDNNPSLSKIEKFNHLLTCLTDQALGTVKAFQVTDDNYEKALKRLKERYDNDCLIFLENIAQLFELPKIPKASATQLRSLVDNISALFNSLQSIGSESDISNAIIIHIAMNKVDSESQSKWDEQLEYKKLPTWTECAAVLAKRCQYLEARESKNLHTDNNNKAFKRTRAQHFDHRPQASLVMAQRSCCFCKDSSHTISNCSNFNKLSTSDRFTNVKKLGLCINCLGQGHSVAKCHSTYKCRNCHQSHHTLLHRPTANKDSSSPSPQSTSTSQEVISSAATNSALEKDNGCATAQVILATALVLVKDASGTFQFGRALLDSGSQVNFIKEDFARSLRLPTQRKTVDIIGIGCTETKISSLTQTIIRSRFSTFELPLEFLVSPSITGYQPDALLNTANWNLPKNIEFADPQFNRPAQIDMLVGAESFFDLLKRGQIKLGEERPSLQNTHLGWIVSGRYKSLSSTQKISSCLSSTEGNLNEFVERFWELESVSGQKSKYTEEQLECEAHFTRTLEELPSGRLMVKLPFKKDTKLLGDSYNIAFRRFLALERRLCKNPSLRSSYVDFLREYLTLGHMTLVRSPKLDQPHYYLPHQGVLRPNSISTKLRVVFDASCRTSSQVSLNGVLMAGPTIQDDLFIILLRFRLHRFALTADIVKMYRQVLIHPLHRQFQYILWRENEQCPIQTYALNTVTYGTTSAPFLAIRCLKFLGDKFENQFKLGAGVLRSDFYVDDMLTGADDVNTLAQLQYEVSTILKSGGFDLSKWYSNHRSILSTQTNKQLRLTESNLTSTLGIIWDSSNDEFCFSYNPNRTYSSFTKRSILSLASSLFDPMGLLNPIIVKAKIILQRLWIDKIEWDAAIPQHIETEWRQFMDDLKSLQNISVPRFVLAPNRKSVQIHGFCDASIKAYGCCIYIRTTNEVGSTSVKLLVAKSRVAPSKAKQLPRLELCSAHLLAKLWTKIKPLFEKFHPEIFFWTDSLVVLYWISTHSSSLSTFVGNRVAEIQERTVEVVWKHVPTDVNPADIVSRGCTVKEILQSIWFSGPSFLLESSENWPANPNISLPVELLTLEKRKTAMVGSKLMSNPLLDVINKQSSYVKLLRTFGYIQRFLSRLKNKTVPQSPILSPEELQSALYRIVWIIQTTSFLEEIRLIEKGENLRNSLKWLSLFLDKVAGYPVLRVGGRLKNANIPEEQKHPILIPKDSHFAKCFARHLHITNYHAGPKTLVALMRGKFWIVNARDLSRKVVRECIHCTRYRPKLMNQVMGDLPAERVNVSRPFLRCGIDFCGPIYIYHRIRGKVPYKSYIAVFVCLSSKAVHLEPVSDLSSDAFIAALKRMISRRGLPCDIFCDNATNFVGAQSKLSELRNLLFHKPSYESILKFCSIDNINFRFIPPRAPHFGGIWEAAVKVAKGHLYRSLNNTKLSFEELTTALCEIEAIMNSRPLTPLTNDPNDFEVLTPAHLLIGSSLKSIPVPADDAADTSILQYWRRIQNIKTHFWRRWSLEYVTELQQRSRWSSAQPNIPVGSLVIIHDDNLPPQKWLMGRVQKAVPGRDGRVRVAEVRTSKGVFSRPIHKLALLPC